MLSKLIKYDLKYIYKQLIIFYGITIVLAIIARLTDGVYEMVNPPFLLIFIHEFAQGAAFGFMLGAFINASMRIWARIKYTLYGDESYLTHTLPLKRSTVWLAKFLTVVIVLLVNILLLAIVALIVYYSPEIFETWYSHTDMNTCWTILAVLLGLFSQVLFIIMSGIAGIILGHRHNHNPMAHAVIYGIIIYLAGGMLIMAACFVWSRFDSNINQIMFEGNIHSAYDVNLLFYIISAFYAVLITTLYITKCLSINGI